MALAQQIGVVDVITEAKLQLALLQKAEGKSATALKSLREVESEAGQIGDTYLQTQARTASQEIRTSR